MNTKISIFCCSLLLLIGFRGIAQVNILGKSGYMVTPSAAWEEKQFGLSFAYMPREYATNIFNYEKLPSPHHLNIYSTRAKFTNFWEINLNIVNRPASNARHGVGDRQLDFRFRLLKETKFFPSVVLGWTPPGSVSPLLAHDYIVTTKNLNTDFGDFSFTLGYGLPFVFDKNEDHTSIWNYLVLQPKSDFINGGYLSGFFGGLSYEPVKFGGLMLEYDTHTINAGAYIKPLDWFLIQGYSIEGKEWAFNFSANFPLNFSPRALRRYEKKMD